MKTKQNTYLVKIIWDFAMSSVVVIAKTEKEAIRKAKIRFPNYQILSIDQVIVIK